MVTDGSTKFKGGRGDQWSFTRKVKGKVLRHFEKGLEFGDFGEAAFLTAELFSPVVYSRYSSLFSKIRGPKIAVFHDAIALRLPEFTPKKTRNRIPKYLLELLDFDGIIAVSHSSSDDLKSFWASHSVPGEKQPVIRVIPNASSFRASAGTQTAAVSNQILVVGTIEGRKNHVSLLKAAKILWDENRDFTLIMIGGLNPETGSKARQMISELVKADYPVYWKGTVSDDELTRAYQNCKFTVYPSLWEGFGLPVLESLSLGKPCVCTPFGALREVAENGGCLLVENGEPESLARGMRTLLENNGELKRLAKEACQRKYRTWDDHAKETLEFIEELRSCHQPRPRC